jgi:hypothetical protein
LWEHSIVYVVDKVNGSSFVADQAQSMLPSPKLYRVCYSAADFADPGDFLLKRKSKACLFHRFEMATGKLVAAGDCTDSRYSEDETCSFEWVPRSLMPETRTKQCFFHRHTDHRCNRRNKRSVFCPSSILRLPELCGSCV